VCVLTQSGINGGRHADGNKEGVVVMCVDERVGREIGGKREAKCEASGYSRRVNAVTKRIVDKKVRRSGRKLVNRGRSRARCGCDFDGRPAKKWISESGEQWISSGEEAQAKSESAFDKQRPV
jgi:hypothetical protein